jgi:hypothetical protein
VFTDELVELEKPKSIDKDDEHDPAWMSDNTYASSDEDIKDPSILSCATQ